MSDLFDSVAEQLVRSDPAVSRAKMFASDGLRVGGKFFAFAKAGELVVKLPAPRVAELLGSGAGRVFTRGQKGVPMKEWVCLRPTGEAEALGYVTEARAFVGSLAGA
jgi:TfoX/Sxy family transcriptional regulator of competence genes